ncbi:uncharacterized protein L3040_005631 [Drepanopeziza brunnea f. sp. 'multigermtubi']|uniref:Uncharacterized protein n=1 Tax=Marssonina brunnea f. sp. multigermtubi (strain MB_m1) TaxID=1072389 RepID=K1XMR5_MARBU|nr:uncharacterized protein MBM_07955 [Drepanopeziza brunnea f. sp. 'multigermtubi' MB_m1]EKD13754.1 hypothetical protein MBM_07955 [Drepanopeziza brunnea f. sp. 'multigermtubi' MB_m1]KAJ5041077.1 hypothetical protein L3040_005631 [Drepanopeziza brunnea f. sp. 'multigermtubi']
MPPPPVTPSPHRFVIKQERRPPSRSTPLQEHTSRPSTQQFNPTPRFSFSSTPRPTASQTLPRITPSAARYFTPANKPSKQHDAIELSSDDDGLRDVQESIETEEQDVDLEGYDSADLDEDCKLDEPSPKRRRLSTSPAHGLEESEEQPQELSQVENHESSLSSSLPMLSSPPAPRRPISTTAPRFLLSTPAPQSTPRDATLAPQTATPFLKPPRFRPPDPSETSQMQTDPLPEQFSPHRRGQKYVPGGLAAEVRDWLMNLEGALESTKEKRDKSDEWLVKILIHEASGGSREGFTMVKGRQAHETERGGEMADTIGIMKVMLAGEGQATGLQKSSNAEVGKTVGIKGPVWEVVIEGEKWGIGVDWKVLA